MYELKDAEVFNFSFNKYTLKHSFDFLEPDIVATRMGWYDEELVLS